MNMTEIFAHFIKKDIYLMLITKCKDYSRHEKYI